MRSSSFHPFLRLDARTGSLRLPATIRSPDPRNRTLVQSSFVPNSSGALTAVVVSGGKQYRVASGDRILVDRVAAEPGARLSLDRVLMVADGDELKLGAEALAGLVVTARVLEHRRGPKIDVLRYHSKKRVRVHKGARAELTALEIVSVGAPPEETPAEEATAKPAKSRRKEPRAAEPDVAEPQAAAEPEAAQAEAAEPEATEPETEKI
jgi:large subunit ribosomal protein L21